VLNVSDTEITCETFSGADTEVPNSVDELLFHSSATLGRLAFLDTQGFGFFLPNTEDDVGIQAAIDAAAADSGGIVLLGDTPYTIANTVVIKTNVILTTISSQGGLLIPPSSLAAPVVQMQSNSALIGASLACVSMTAGAYDAVEVLASGDNITIDRLRVLNAPRHGVLVNESCTAVNISNCTIVDPEQSGIVVEDDNDDNDNITISNIVVDDPGADGTTVDVAAVKVQGRVTLSNIQAELTRGGVTKARGVWFDSKAAGGGVRARNCELNGFKMRGIGPLAIGVELGGEKCVASGGTVELTGASSRGILFDSSKAGGEVADFNQVSDTHIQGCDTGVLLTSDAHDNLVSGVSVAASATNAVSDLGTRNAISGGVFNQTAATASIDYGSSAVDGLVSNARIVRNGSGSGVRVDTSSTRCKALRCEFLNCATQVEFPATGAPTCVAYDCSPGPRREVYYRKSSDSLAIDASGQVEFLVPGMSGLRLPGPAPDGTRIWRWRSGLLWDINTGTTHLHFRWYLGPLGTTADTLIYHHLTSGGTPTGAENYYFPHFSQAAAVTANLGALSTNSARDFAPHIWDQGNADDLVDWPTDNIAETQLWGFYMRPLATENLLTLTIQATINGAYTIDIEEGTFLHIEHIQTEDV
jgi:hypothetical protein